MAKKRRKSGPVEGRSRHDPLDAALARGDFTATRRLAARRRDDPEASPEARERALVLLRKMRFDPVHVGLLVAGLVIWAVAFWLGVLARQ